MHTGRNRKNSFFIQKQTAKNGTDLYVRFRSLAFPCYNRLSGWEKATFPLLLIAHLLAEDLSNPFKTNLRGQLYLSPFA